jgi:signal transduction histidine kinase
VHDAMASIRLVAAGLRCSSPRTNLKSALLNDIRKLDTAGIEISIRVNGDEGWADPPVRDECALILREATRNAVEHARPAHVAINVDITPQDIRALVEDDGTGFDEATIHAGVGLAAMRERADLLGGTLSVHSRPPAGTRVRFVVPLHGAGS